jgi:hypothetical protein
MSLLDQIGALTRAFLTADEQLKNLQRQLDDIQQQSYVMANRVHDIDIRIARLEAARDADRAQLETQIARFQLEVEKARLHFSRGLPSASEE